MKPEAFERVKHQLIIDEGVRLVVYKDSLGYPTVGVGHLVLEEDALAVGQTITQAQCDAFFAHDLQRTVDSCEAQIAGWQAFPDEIQEILVNMAYNLGIAGLLKFVRTLELLRQRLYSQAADALVESRWYGQVGNRSKRIVARVRAFTPAPVVVVEDKEAPKLEDILMRRFLCRREGNPVIVEMSLLRLSPSGDYVQLGAIGNGLETAWLSRHEFTSTINILEFLDEAEKGMAL